MRQYIKGGGNTKSWREAKRQAIADIVKEFEISTSKSKAGHQITGSLIELSPEKFAKCLPIVKTISI